MIDVIIPAYNAHETISRTLYSISIQTIVDKLKVYIINDASDKDYNEYVEFFKNFMDIQEIKLKKNGGPGIARREGLNKSHSDYIMFIDSDDILAAPNAIENLYRKSIDNRYDLIVGNFLEQTIDNEYIPHKFDKTWLHGKLYKRSFLDDHSINFNDSRANEDNAFNRSILLRSPKTICVNKEIYYWLYNENSITRRNEKEYSYKGLFGYVDNMVWVLKDAIKNKIEQEKISCLAFSVLYAMYYYYLQFAQEDLAASCKELLNIVDKYPVTNESTLETLIREQTEESSKQVSKDKIKNPSITFEEFTMLVRGA